MYYKAIRIHEQAGVPIKTINLFKRTFVNTKSIVKTWAGNFEINQVVRQGGSLSATVFNISM